MKRTAIVGLLICWLAPTVALAASPVVPDDVKASIKDRARAGDNASVVVGMINRDGNTSYGYGEMRRGEGRKVGKSTIYEIGSITKVFTGLLLTQAVERGEVALDEPVSKYLPEQVTFPSGVTLRHLATHRSGLPKLPVNLVPQDPFNPYAGYGEEQLHAFLAGWTPDREAGAAFEYSNVGSGLLGHVLARAAGKSYEELLVERIAVPLGLADTRITLTPQQQDRFATGHDGPNERAAWDLGVLAGAGALRSTVRDMLVFLSATTGTVPSTMLDSMLATWTDLVEADGPGRKIGLGWNVLEREGQRLVWHNGETGGFHSFCGFIPARTAVVVLSNSRADIDDIGLHLLVPDLVPLREIEGVPEAKAPRPQRKEISLEPEILARYVGRYEFAPGLVLDVTLEEGQLGAQLAGQPRFPVYAESEIVFFYKIVDAQLVFELDAEGNATQVVLHQGGIRQIAKKNP